MNEFFKYVDLPEIPRHLILDISEIEKQENVFTLKKFFYKKYEISNELNLYLKDIFNFEFVAQYQVIRNYIPIHKDIGRTECFNYLLDNGGESSSLDIYEDDKQTKILSEKIDNFKWHWINVSKYHGVSGLTNKPRYSITVTPANSKF